MAQAIGYEAAPWKLTDEQMKFFADMEAELGTTITIIHSGGVRAERPTDAEGVVFLDFSTHSENTNPRKVEFISRRNKTTVPLKNQILLREDKEREHIFDFNGFPLCELRLNTMWGLTPLQNFPTEALMKEFWADAIRFCTQTEFFAERERAKMQRVRDAFLQAMRASSKTDIESKKKELETATRNLADLNQQLVQTQANIFRTEGALELAEKIAEGDNTTYEEEIASLMDHRDVREIGFDSSNGHLEIYTNMIYMYSPNRQERVALGEFKIRVATRQSNVVTLHNLTNQRSHKMHPHVEQNGNACWGAVGSQIAKLAASCKIEGLADLCVRYLETYNVQDTNATYARYWFTEKDTQKKRKDFDNQYMTDQEYSDATKAKKAAEEAAKAAKKEKPAKATKEEVEAIEKLTVKEEPTAEEKELAKNTPKQKA